MLIAKKKRLFKNLSLLVSILINFEFKLWMRVHSFENSLLWSKVHSMIHRLSIQAFVGIELVMVCVREHIGKKSLVCVFLVLKFILWSVNLGIFDAKTYYRENYVLPWRYRIIFKKIHKCKTNVSSWKWKIILDW